MYNIDFDELSRNAEGQKVIALSLSQSGYNFDTQNDRENWDLYHDKIDEKQFEYLTKIGEHYLPAKVRHVPVQRPFCERLVSRFDNRPFKISISVINKKGVLKKQKESVSEFVEAMLQRHQQTNQMIIAQIQKIGQQKGMLQRQMQQEKDPAKVQQMQMAITEVEASLNSIIDQLNNKSLLNEKELQRWKTYLRYEKKDIREQLITKRFQQRRNELHLHRTGRTGFVSTLVTGRQAYLVYAREGDRMPIFQPLNISSVFYPQTESISWIHHASYAGFKVRMSYSEIMRNFGYMMNPQQLAAVKRYSSNMDSTTDGNFVKTSEDGSIYTGAVGIHSEGTGYEVTRVWWKAGRWLRVIANPNPYREGKYFYSILGENDKAIDVTEYKYDDREKEYTSKQDGTKKFKRSEVRAYNPNKGMKYMKRYVEDLYYGIVIGNIVLAGKDYMQLRPEDDYSTVYLPIVGPAFNSITNQPYSPINSTKELQFQYDLVAYHEEVMMALAGTKTLLYDRLHKPTNMTDDEWEYQKKMGTVEIETKKAGITSPQSNFNQWTVLDLSLSASIQYLDRIKKSIELQIGMLFGLTPQSMGIVDTSDQVGTFQMSQQTSDMITEALYSRHDETFTEACNMLINIDTKYFLDEGDVFTMIAPDGNAEFVKIPKGILDETEFYFMGHNNNKEERGLSELKNIALREFSAGKMQMGNFVKMYSIDNLKELEMYAQQVAQETNELQMRMQQGGEEAKAAAQERLITLKAELEGKMKEQENALKQMDIQVKQQKLEIEKYLEERAQNIQIEKDRAEKALRILELSNEKESEDNVLVYNDKHSTVDEQLRAIEIQLNAIMQASGLKIDREFNIGKLQVEDKKAKKMVKEHASDR